MEYPCFLGAGIATHLGTGHAAQLAGLRRPPGPPQLLQRPIGDRVETVPYKLLADFPLQALKTRLYRALDSTIAQALDAAGLTAAQQQRMGLFIGSSSFDISISEYLLEADRHSLPMRQSSSFGNLALRTRQRFDLRGPDFSFNTACTASANALWYAARMIRAGLLEHALVVGVELINDITALGFHGLDLLTASVMKPFDAGRDGLVLGESCAALVLGSGPASRFHLRGGANLCDTHSMSAANTDGSTIANVITQALAEAGVDRQAIRAVKTHGTASLLNDDAESAGLLRVFAPMPPLCALKPFVGHTLGACGLTELILFWQALEAGFLIATPGIGADPAALGVSLTQTPQPVQSGSFLLDYFGFGGNNTALVITREATA